MDTIKTLRILGKRGRITVPEEIRDEIGLERGDIVSFEILDDDSAVIRRERLCDNCVTESNQTDMMKLLVKAMQFAHPGESAQDAFEFLTDLTPPQRFDCVARIIADWAEKLHEK